MKRLVALLVLMAVSPGWSFNLWTDIEQNTRWDLGDSAAAGTAIALQGNDQFNLRDGQVIGSALAEVGDYRFLSFWVGGNFIPQPDGSLKAVDTMKFGLNVAYVVRNFANQPPGVIKNLVVGPSISTSLWTSPHVFVPFVDVNYQFGAK